MEFTENQTKQLEGIKQWAQVNILQSRCEQIKLNLENLQTERKRCLEKKEQLIRRLEGDVLERMAKAIEEEESARQKLELVKKSTSESKDSKSSSFSVPNISLLLGYQISKCLLLLEQTDIQNTSDYKNGCHVTYNELKQLYEFVEAQTHHSEFAEIWTFLHSSQDLQGLLVCLKKLFPNKG